MYLQGNTCIQHDTRVLVDVLLATSAENDYKANMRKSLCELICQNWSGEETNLMKHTSVAIGAGTLLNSDFHREDKAILVGTNHLPWTSTKEVAFLCLFVAT